MENELLSEYIDNESMLHAVRGAKIALVMHCIEMGFLVGSNGMRALLDMLTGRCIMEARGLFTIPAQIM